MVNFTALFVNWKTSAYIIEKAAMKTKWKVTLCKPFSWLTTTLWYIILKDKLPALQWPAYLWSIQFTQLSYCLYETRRESKERTINCHFRQIILQIFLHHQGSVGWREERYMMPKDNFLLRQSSSVLSATRKRYNISVTFCPSLPFICSWHISLTYLLIYCSNNSFLNFLYGSWQSCGRFSKLRELYAFSVKIENRFNKGHVIH